MIKYFKIRKLKKDIKKLYITIESLENKIKTIDEKTTKITTKDIILINCYSLHKLFYQNDLNDLKIKLEYLLKI